MKVLNLRCGHDHRFEGWFASEADYLAQHEGQLIACPLCDDTVISRLPSAPRLILSRQRDSQSDSDSAGASASASASAGAGTSAASHPREGASASALADSGHATGATMERMHSKWLSEMRQMLSNTEDVGDRFSEEARRIHYGEVKERGIRGQASPDEAQALRDEGIEVMSIALPAALKGPVQ